MVRNKRRAIYNIAMAPLIILSLSYHVHAGSLRQKLVQQTDYRVHANTPVEQLIEVARRFQIPMAIEWLDQPADDRAHKLDFGEGQLIELIKAIMAEAPQQAFRVENRFVRVFPPQASGTRMNFLNFKLREFCISHESVLGAAFQLRIILDEMFYPEYFKYGYAGGYGGGEWLLLIDQLTICLTRPSVREVLDEIVGQSGRAAWLVRLKPEELQGSKPFWKNAPKNGSGDSPFTARWSFLELREYH
jgi:hypothetical protein